MSFVCVECGGVGDPTIQEAAGVSNAPSSVDNLAVFAPRSCQRRNHLRFRADGWTYLL